MRSIIFLTCFLLSASAVAQVAESGFHVTWSIMVPTYKEYVGNTSTNNFRVGFTRFLNERFGFGIDGGYAVLDDYVPRQTYTYPGGAITTDMFNYMYYYTLTGSGKYFFIHDGLVVPYVALGAGASFTDYTIYYNAYTEVDEKFGFLIRPELGTYFRFEKYSALGLKASVTWDYTTNKSDHIDVKNFSGLGFQIGLVLFSN
ncbi:MAG: hypothetical protein KF687_00060 [Cyclobacteriaceae bacterium]|nr:hypothetical protein [Cyclobacteriaceae bacterium]